MVLFMNVVVFGANGKVGQLLVQELLDRGHSVVAFVHSSHNFKDNPKLQIQKGDVRNYTVVLKALSGSEATISVLGSWGTKTKDILTNGMRSILPAMEDNGTNRIISLTGAAARLPEETLSIQHKLSRFMLALVDKRILNDAEKHLEILRTCNKEWTVIRSPIMKSGYSSQTSLSRKPPKIWTRIARQSVAKIIVDELEQNRFIKQAPFVAAK